MSDEPTPTSGSAAWGCAGVVAILWALVQIPLFVSYGGWWFVISIPLALVDVAMAIWCFQVASGSRKL